MLGAMSRSNLTPGLRYASAGRGAGLIGGKILSLPGGVSEDPKHPGVLVGEVSGLMARAVPRILARRFQAIPQDLMLEEDWDIKLARAAELTLDMDVRAVIMVPSWAPLLFDEIIKLASRRGPRGFSELAIRDIWPRLRVFFSGGVALRSYRSALERYLGPDMDFVESYSASEGFFAFQDHIDSPELLLHIDSGVFYEFVRVDQLHQPNPRRHTVGDVEIGVDYAMFVTTCSGLWGYGVGDVVRFTSTKPHRIVVVGRTASVLDEFGEALYSNEVDEAIQCAARSTGLYPLHHHLTYRSTRSSIPGHELLVEFSEEPGDEMMFLDVFDRDLQVRNRHYRIRREPGAMTAPVLTKLPSGTCLTFLKERNGRASAQSKLLSMSPSREIAENLMSVAARLGDRPDTPDP
jgi:hypothetical protein